MTVLWILPAGTALGIISCLQSFFGKSTDVCQEMSENHSRPLMPQMVIDSEGAFNAAEVH